jgi:cytidylate kinase
MDVLRVSREAAAVEVDRIDRARTNYMQSYYGLKWTDPHNFDLCIDVSSFQETGSAALIVSAVQSR